MKWDILLDLNRLYYESCIKWKDLSKSTYPFLMFLGIDILKISSILKMTYACTSGKGTAKAWARKWEWQDIIHAIRLELQWFSFKEQRHPEKITKLTGKKNRLLWAWNSQVTLNMVMRVFKVVQFGNSGPEILLSQNLSFSSMHVARAHFFFPSVREAGIWFVEHLGDNTVHPKESGHKGISFNYGSQAHQYF